jgi:N-acyl-D-amino-acid deacylase
MIDTIIAGGEVYDGTGDAPRSTDIGISRDRIAALGDLSRAEARLRIDAQGRIVTPGFIDVHSHSDAYLLLEPHAHSKLFQGITTEIVGNCGCSGGPRLDGVRMPADWQEFDYPRKWRTLAEYRALLEEVGPALNVGLLVGHNNLRASVMGYSDRRADPGDLAQMRALLAESLDAGAIGFSTGLLYSPGMFAGMDEVEALLSETARRGGIYATHMRSEGAELLEALEETIGMAERAGCRLEISHLKTSGPANWHKIDALLERIDTARADGLELAADRYPYTAACTDLDVILPAWAAAGERSEILARLRDPGQRARIRVELLSGRADDYWGRVMVGATRHPDNIGFRGMRLDAVAAELGMEAVDAALHLIESDELHTGGIFFGMSAENMQRILAQDYVMIGSDGSLRAPSGALSHDHPHPRNYGAFTRFLRMAIDGETVALPEAVRKMTSLPAEQFRLRDRGLVRPGYFADIAVFDPGRILEKSSYAQPHQLSEGLQNLLVNGRAVISDGCLQDARPGWVLD